MDGSKFQKENGKNCPNKSPTRHPTKGFLRYHSAKHRYGLAVVCQARDVEGLSPTATSTDPERYNRSVLI